MILFDTFEEGIFEGAQSLLLYWVVIIRSARLITMMVCLMLSLCITMHNDNIRHVELRILSKATNCAFFTVSVFVTSYGT